MKKIKASTRSRTATRNIKVLQAQDIKARRAIHAIVGGVRSSALTVRSFSRIVEA